MEGKHCSHEIRLGPWPHCPSQNSGQSLGMQFHSWGNEPPRVLDSWSFVVNMHSGHTTTEAVFKRHQDRLLIFSLYFSITRRKRNAYKSGQIWDSSIWAWFPQLQSEDAIICSIDDTHQHIHMHTHTCIYVYTWLYMYTYMHI